MKCIFNEIAKKQIEDIKNAISTNKAWHWYNAEADYLRTITERPDGKFLATKGNYSAVSDKNLGNDFIELFDNLDDAILFHDIKLI